MAICNLESIVVSFILSGERHRMSALYERFLDWAEDGRISGEFLWADDNPYPNRLDDHIATLFGYRDANDMVYNYRGENRHLAQLLLSSNGWAIYKMLLARMDG